MFEEHESVELNRDLPEFGLVTGAHGAIVMVYREGEAYEVEFFDDAGQTIAVETVGAADLHRRPPRTARELIAHLQRLPAETLVLVQGYEDGFSPIASISYDSPVQELAGRPYYCGPYEHPDEAARLAAEDPNGWISMEGGPPTLVGEPMSAIVLFRELRGE